MNNAVAARQDSAEIVENVLIKGDLGKLSPQERANYYTAVCRSVGLNPLTKPFEYIVLNGKLTLYALRGCTDQLRSIHNVSVDELTETERDGVFVVTAKVRNGEGRTDMAKGAVTITQLKGDALANALMKCETKAKRRATLSICGLGLLDETELETIPTARPNPHVVRADDIHDDIPTPEDSIPRGDPDIKPLRKIDQRPLSAKLQEEMHATETLVELGIWGEENKNRIAQLSEDWQRHMRALYRDHKDKLVAAWEYMEAKTNPPEGRRGSMKDQLEEILEPLEEPQ